MKATPTAASIDAYIAAAVPAVRPILKKLRATIRKAAPGAEERISYRMPAFFLDGVVIYFAAFQKHIGIFPPVSGDAALERDLARYRGEKGNLRFPLAEPIPYELVARVTRARLADLRAKAAARRNPATK